MIQGSYENSVFVNCPFDAMYRPLFEAVTFCIYDCGFVARCALEADDGSQVRIEKINALIRDCRLAVHDISRTELDPATALPRFNMPLELGIFLGIKYAGGGEQRRKAAIILDSERYRYQMYVSDLAGQDIRPHFRRPAEAIRRVRDFLASHAGPDTRVPGGDHVARRYVLFRRQLPQACAESKLRPSRLTFRDLATLIVGWIGENSRWGDPEPYTRSSSATGTSRKSSARGTRSPTSRSAPVNTSR